MKPVNLADTFHLQLAQQASLYDLSNHAARQYCARLLSGVFVELCVAADISCAVEVGAHEAWFSQAVRSALPLARVFAYEANPHVFANHVQILSEQGIHYENRLIAETCGEKRFHILATIDGKEEPCDGKRHSILERLGCEDVAEQIALPCATLDAVFDAAAFAETLFALWIDAEGAGLQVLQGGEVILARTALLYIEVESIAKWREQVLDRDIIAFLLERGFFPVMRDFQFRHQYNMVFVRKDLYATVEVVLHQYQQRRIYDRIKSVAEKTRPWEQE